MATINYLTAIEFDFGAVAKTADVAAAISEIRRVFKPGGTPHFIEQGAER